VPLSSGRRTVGIPWWVGSEGVEYFTANMEAQLTTSSSKTISETERDNENDSHYDR